MWCGIVEDHTHNEVNTEIMTIDTIYGGHYVKRLSFPDHVPTPLKLSVMLQYCTNLVELSIPTSKLGDSNQLEKVVQSVGTSQKLIFIHH